MRTIEANKKPNFPKEWELEKKNTLAIDIEGVFSTERTLRSGMLDVATSVLGLNPLEVPENILSDTTQLRKLITALTDKPAGNAAIVEWGKHNIKNLLEIRQAIQHAQDNDIKVILHTRAPKAASELLCKLIGADSVANEKFCEDIMDHANTTIFIDDCEGKTMDRIDEFFYSFDFEINQHELDILKYQIGFVPPMPVMKANIEGKGKTTVAQTNFEYFSFDLKLMPSLDELIEHTTNEIIKQRSEIKTAPPKLTPDAPTHLSIISPPDLLTLSQMPDVSILSPSVSIDLYPDQNDSKNQTNGSVSVPKEIIESLDYFAKLFPPQQMKNLQDL